MFIHAIFDILAWLTAFATAFFLRRTQPQLSLNSHGQWGYRSAVIIGAAIGAVGLGTANLWLSGQTGMARSIEGALFGAIVGVELFKWATGIRVRTGAIFALPLALGIAVGRIGCFLAGLEDFTYGTPTDLPWGYDFGDHIKRHPVQLYEALTMAGFAVFYVVQMRAGNQAFLRRAFAFVVLLYGAQRFCWEFLKPYGSVLGPLTLFHFISAALIFYALFLLNTDNHAEQQSV